MRNGKSKTKDIARTLFFVLLGLAFVWWFWEKLSAREKEEMWEALGRADWLWFTLSGLATLLSHYIRALRWRLLGEAISCKVSRRNSFFAVMSGYLTNLAVPRLGEVVRCTMLRKSDGVPLEKSLGTIITERATDMLLFLFLLLLTLCLQADVLLQYTDRNFKLDTQHLLRLMLIGAGCMLVCIAAFFFFRKRLKENKAFRKIVNLLKGLWEGVKSISRLKRPLLFIAYSMLIWLLWIIGTLCCFRSMGGTETLSFLQALVTTVLGAFGPMITPGGIGLQPAIYAEVLQAFAISRPIGYACGWLSWIASQICTVIAGLAAFVYFSTIKKKQNDDTDRGNRE